jgi:uncharacterized protein
MEAVHPPIVVATAGVDERAAFLTRTYTHLAAAIIGFVALEAVLVNSPAADWMLQFVGSSRFAWLVVLGGFMLMGYVANKWAVSATSMNVQYAGLSLYVVAESVIFLPLLAIAARLEPGVIPKAGVVTVVLFGGLTGVVFVTRKDFSFLRGVLGVAGLCALGLIVAGLLFGFSPGLWFTVAMIGLACGYVLYYTSNVLHHYRTDQHVAASLALFAAIALLFWYVLQLFLSRRR